MIWMILFIIVAVYAFLLTLGVIRNRVGTIHIKFTKEGEVRMGIYDAVDPEEMAKMRLAIFRVDAKRE